MRKKVIPLLLILIMTMSVFSACSTDKPDSDTSTPLTSGEEMPIQTVPSTQPRSTEPSSNTEEPSETSEPPSVDTSGQKLIAFTFDDGPGPYTKTLIEELNKRGAKATFFMLGQRAENYGETIKFMYESGHQLGSHTYSHKDITKISNDEFLSEMQRTDDAIKSACGQPASAFRPPYGAYNAEKLGLQDKTPTHWSVDTMDWKTKNAESVKNHILTHAKDGSIVLMHDIYETSAQGAIAAIDALQAEGFKFVTVNELVTRNGDPITTHEIYFSCVPKTE